MVRRRGGASRSELNSMIAGGNHTIIQMTPPYKEALGVQNELQHSVLFDDAGVLFGFALQRS